MKRKINLILINSLLIALFFFVLTPSAIGATFMDWVLQNKEGQSIKFTPNVSIPGSDFSKGSTLELGIVNEDNKIIEGNLAGQYIAALYKFFVGIAGIVAVVMISLGGFIWLFSGGSPDKISKAKELILGAIFGLLLALGSYLILYTINPQLVDFSLAIKQVPLPKGECVPVKNSDHGCHGLVDLDPVYIKSAGTEVVLKMQAPAALKLQQLALAWHNDTNNNIGIRDAFRSHQIQAYYNCIYGGGRANEAFTSTHEQGIAFDVNFEASGIDQNNYSQFVSLASSHNFKVDTFSWGASESWHFTYTGGNVASILTICPYAQFACCQRTGSCDNTGPDCGNNGLFVPNTLCNDLSGVCQ